MSVWRRELVQRLAALGLKPEREAEIVEELVSISTIGSGSHRPRSESGRCAGHRPRSLDAPGELARRLAEFIQAAEPSAARRAVPRTMVAGALAGHATVRPVAAPIAAFTVTVIVTLALTVGPTTAMLSIGTGCSGGRRPASSSPIGWRLSGWANGDPRRQRQLQPVGRPVLLNLDDLRQASTTLTGITGVQEGSAEPRRR